MESPRSIAPIFAANGASPRIAWFTTRVKWITRFPEFETSLWRVPVHGGQEEKVLESVMRNYVVVEEGIFFFSQTHQAFGHNPSEAYPQFYRFESRETEVIEQVEMSYKDHGLSVSPDGRSFLFTDEVRSGSDLVMLEGFQ